MPLVEIKYSEFVEIPKTKSQIPNKSQSPKFKIQNNRGGHQVLDQPYIWAIGLTDFNTALRHSSIVFLFSSIFSRPSS